MIPSLASAGLGRFGGTGGALAGKLDAYLANGWAAYSCLYVLDVTHVGSPLIRVRRSSDDAEDDIGHDGSGFVDVAAALAFAGGSSLFVRKQYDQVASNDIDQSTNAAQPRIVNAGTFDKGMKFNGTSHWMATPAVPTGPAWSFLMTHKVTGTPGAATTWSLLESGASVNPNGFIWLMSDNVTGPPDNFGGVRWATTDNGTHFADRCVPLMYVYDFGSAGERNAIALIVDRSQSLAADQVKIVTQEGAIVLSPGANQTGINPSTDFDANVINIGARNGGASLFTPMNLQNLVIYTAAKSVADMTAATALIPLYT